MRDCPKRMVYGPCGGVREDLECELGGGRCPFTAGPVAVWSGPTPPDDPPTVPDGLLDRAGRRPVLLVDLTVRPYDRQSVRDVVGVLAPTADALLVGEHQNRPDLPPTLFAAEVLAAGGRPWTTLTCRDRNRVVLEQELVGLASLGLEGVLCVTGDGRGQGVRPDATQVFDLDGTRLASMAAAAGLVATVPEAPTAPPVALRPARLAQKERAGARLCVLNHVRGPQDVGRFVGAARAAGVRLPFVAGVAVYTDERSAQVLARFPGLGLDAELVAAVLGSSDPVEAGVEAAVAEAQALLAVPGVVGVNLSGLASARGELAAAEVKAEVGRRLLDRLAAGLPGPDGVPALGPDGG